MDIDRKKAKEQFKELSSKDKFKYFWDYYKIHTVAIIFIIVLTVYFVKTVVFKTKYDLSISCYSSTLIEESTLDKFVSLAKENIDEITGNDEIDIEFIPTFVSFQAASEQNMAYFQKFMAELAAGSSFGYVFDQGFYDFLKDGYGEYFENVVLLNDIPVMKEKLGLDDEQKLYYSVKVLYANEKNDEKAISKHNNAVKFAEYLKSL